MTISENTVHLTISEASDIIEEEYDSPRHTALMLKHRLSQREDAPEWLVNMHCGVERHGENLIVRRMLQV